MVIYADVLFITNLYIDFFLLICVKKFLKLNTSKLRLLCGALVGAVYSLSALLPSLPQVLSVFLGIFGALCVTLTAFAPIEKLMLLKTTLCFYVFSFIFAGFFLLIYHLFPVNNLAVRNGLVYFNISPLMLFIFTLLAYLVAVLFRRIFSWGDNHTTYCSFVIEHCGKTKKIFAKADTGNGLREPFSDLPVIIVEQEAVRDLLPESILSYIETGSCQEKIRLIPFSAMGGSGILPAFRPDLIYLSKSKAPVECYLAVYSKKLSAGQFNALFHPEILPEVKSDRKLHLKH